MPFNPAVATRFLKYWNDTLPFQSDLDYLKNPPLAYQQPAVDLVGGLSDLQTAVDAGQFQNEYQFEASLQALLTASHDLHMQLYAGALAVFSFASPFDIVSVSLDGLQPPKVYIAGMLSFDSYWIHIMRLKPRQTRLVAMIGRLLLKSLQSLLSMTLTSSSF